MINNHSDRTGQLWFSSKHFSNRRLNDMSSGNSHSAPASASDEDGEAATQTSALDPVCGMKVNPATTAHHATHDGVHYHFCSSGCLAKFTADPAKYLSGSKRAEPVAAPGAMWTCPMHREIRQQGPGTCPICGMALEPEEPSLDNAPNPELVDFTRRWWVSAALAVPLLILTMGTEFLGLHLVDPAYSPWIQFVDCR